MCPRGAAAAACLERRSQWPIGPFPTNSSLHQCGVVNEAISLSMAMLLLTKKCIRAAKVCALVVCALVMATMLVTTVEWLPAPELDQEDGSYDDEDRRLVGTSRLARSIHRLTWSAPLAAEYERQVLADEARIVPGLGEGGAAASLAGARELGEQSLKRLAMNVYLSDRIAYNRSVGDHRDPACAHELYDATLPSASVVVVFHNEPYSVVLRTIWSVVNSARRDRPWFRRARFTDSQGRTMTVGYPGQDPSSQLVYLKEIILVDDNSTLPELKGKLSHYVRTRLPPDLIRILRLPERVGLTRARLAGARAAGGSVLVFLDAHCEAQPDWLRPLLQRIRDDPHAVVMPIIDTISKADFKYAVKRDGHYSYQIGGFSFNGFFKWIDVPEREKQRRKRSHAPTWSPTMAGGLFAMSREYYFQLGGYDDMMHGWGGENLEISFRIWQCGGTLEVVPCSRVGHVFRSFHPYGLPASSDTFGINTARMAEVWMDDYKELFYLHRPDLRNSRKVGDVSSRQRLRAQLQCNSFEWYLRHVYPEKFIPVRDAFGYGRFRNAASGLCLDTLRSDSAPGPLGLYPCRADKKLFAGTQEFTLSRSGELRDEARCAVYADMGSGGPVSGTKAPPNEDAGVIMAAWAGGGRHLVLDTCHKYPDAQVCSSLQLNRKMN
ncbi:polypeptide N-acetylgalactosaminyltransferase 1-like [Pectinophora gossypiella]|uniref:polypeptide N-acetylgalactosaminyltransferase 1-like n=1 Tax=Pectinophora gossypiella TaxID=13191 RepID=UPI00214E1B73|nr:polypeptide N-acetylgalactosaminyltransferase 1-like [Pectinophora gossypiella]